MKFLNIISAIFIFVVVLGASEYKIDFVKAIGDEREDYTFFKINSIVMDDNSKDIYVADLAGHSIAKYDWNGKFIKRIGQKGNGPGDFGIISSLSIYKNKLYAYDYENTRIAEMDIDLSNLNYIKLKSKFFKFCYPIGNNQFIGDFSSIIKDKGRIGIVNKDGDLLFQFFNKIPLQLDYKDRRILFLGALASLTMTLSPERDNLVISFFRPNNPIDFYVYNIKGESLKQFNFKADDKFHFPEHLLNLREPAPESYYSLAVDSVFAHKNNYIAFYHEVSHLSEKNENSDDFCLVFNNSGELIQKIKLDKKIYFFHISNEGYLLGSQLDEEIGKVSIYQLKETKK